jgi:hypothetical protein
MTAAPDLDRWLAHPVLHSSHSRDAGVGSAELWAAAERVRLSDTWLLGRLVRIRIPGIERGITYDELFRNPPFNVLAESAGCLLAGLCGRIWTLKRDFALLDDPQSQFRSWRTPGTVRVLFASWVVSDGPDRATLHSEVRVDPVDERARIAVHALRPFIAAFEGLVGAEALAAAVRRAEREARVQRAA